MITMRWSLARSSAAFWIGGALCAAVLTGPAGASEPAPKARDTSIPTVDLFDGLRQGTVSVSAEGTGDGRMALSVTNNSNRPLRVVLPPGLLASGATGQFGGGGFGGGGGGGFGGGGLGGGGGFGGGGGGGGGGGLGGGLGGGGGGGLGGGLGGGGGGLGGGGGGGTLPATTGMLMLGRLIMSLAGDRDSWDYRSLTLGGLGGGLGGGGIGGGGLGGGGIGGGGLGGGGFRSVPPAGRASVVVRPGQTRELPTRLVSLTGPAAGSGLSLPQKGEVLEIRDIDAIGGMSPRLKDVVKRLAEEKAPETVAQLVLWHVGYGLDWPTLEQISRPWANRSEVALARHFVDRQDEAEGVRRVAETGTLYYELSAARPEHERLASGVSKLLDARPLLGLTARTGVPRQPRGPALSCRVEIADAAASVRCSLSDEAGISWADVGKFSLPILNPGGTPLTPAELTDRLAEGLLDRLVRVHLTREGKGKDAFRIRIENASPFVLSGLTLEGSEPKAESRPSTLVGLSLSPRRALTVPTTHEVMRRQGLTKGIRVLAVDLSGL
jgi:hypothetical protein